MAATSKMLARSGASRVMVGAGRAALVVASTTAMLVACALSGVSPPKTHTSLAPRSQPHGLSPPTVVLTAPTPLAGFRCSGSRYVWASEDARGQLPNQLWTYAPGEVPHKVFTVPSGSIGPLEISGTRAVIGAFIQGSVDLPIAASWSVYMVDLVSTRSTLLAEAHALPITAEVPHPSISGELAVWDQITATGKKVVELQNLDSGKQSTLPIPKGQYPEEPTIRGNRVAYLDANTDPNKPNETWIAYGGTIHVLDLDTNAAPVWDATPDARQLAFNGSYVAWYATLRGSQRDETDVRLTGGLPRSTATLSRDAGAADLSDELVGWYETRSSNVAVRRLAGGDTYRLHFDGGPTYALCGDRILYPHPDESRLYAQRVS